MPESKKRKRKPSKQTKIMETEGDALYESCAGLDVHQETVVANAKLCINSVMISWR